MLIDKTCQTPTSIAGDLYSYKNDPRKTKKGFYVTNIRTYQGGFIPLLDDQNYTDRKRRDLNSRLFDYDDKIHHGSRPLHQTTFDLNYQKPRNDFLTSNQLVAQLFYLLNSFMFRIEF